MNAVEIEQAISELAEQPFDTDEFAYQFLIAFGNKDTTIKRLRAGNNNKWPFSHSFENRYLTRVRRGICLRMGSLLPEGHSNELELFQLSDIAIGPQ